MHHISCYIWEMGGLASLLLLFYCTAVTVSQSCTQEGAVEIIGTVTPTLIAGRLEICVGGLWRAVYDEGWNITEASIVCLQRGFPPESARPCTGSCFGDSPLTNGYFFTCGEQANTLLECQRQMEECCCDRYSDCLLLPNQTNVCCALERTSGCQRLACSGNAGVVCTQPNSTMTELQSTESSEGVSTISVVAIILGVVSGVLLLILLGVVVGWVWFCCRMKQRSKEPYWIESNPSYTTPFSLLTSSIQTQPNECYEHNTSIPTQPNQCYEQSPSTPLYDSVTTPKLIGAKGSQ